MYYSNVLKTGGVVREKYVLFETDSVNGKAVWMKKVTWTRGCYVIETHGGGGAKDCIAAS